MKPTCKKIVTILGPTGDLGSQLTNHLLKKNYTVNIFIRKGSIDKIKRVTKLSKRLKVSVVDSLFDDKLLENIASNSDVIFNMTGLVSLSLTPEAYPSALLINGFFQDFFAKHLRNNKCKYVYASTQRMQNIETRKDINKWVAEIVRAFSNYPINENHAENIILEFLSQYLNKNVIPPSVNIYELSKAVGEHFLLNCDNTTILRISSCYGPGCFARRTVGRLILTRLLGGTIFEKEELRDFVYIEDFVGLCEEIIMTNHKTSRINDCCSGMASKKSEIARLITTYTPGEKGILQVATSTSVETFKPSSVWIKKMLGRDLISLEEGIKKTIGYYKSQYFIHRDGTQKRLGLLYDKIRQETEEHGLDSLKIRKVRKSYFISEKGEWIADPAFYAPTGVVVGYPFTSKFLKKISSVMSKLIKDLNYEKNVWFADAKTLHTTLLNYTHYSENGLKIMKITPKYESLAKNIVNQFAPLKINYRGLMITNNGSIIITGYSSNEEIFTLRKSLIKIGKTEEINQIIHIKIGQILGDIPYSVLQKINQYYASINFGTYTFNSTMTANNIVLNFSSQK